MHTIPRVVLDIDGVFANFNRGFVDTLNEIRTGRPSISAKDYDPPMWNYPQEDLLCSPGELDQIARHIAESGSWWRKLHPYEGAIECLTAINGMMQRQEIDGTFVTTRGGSAANVRFQTMQWLSAHGVTQPQVIVVAGSKMPAIAALDAEAIVDDRPENLGGATTLAIPDHRALFDQRWNRTSYDLRHGENRLHSYSEVLMWLANLPRHPFPAT